MDCVIAFKNRPLTLGASFGRTRTARTVRYRLLNADGAVRVAYTAVGVVEIGYGDYAVELTLPDIFQGFIQWWDVDDGLRVSDAINVVDDVIARIIKIDRVEKGRWKILNNQMIFYEEDGITELIKFDLKDDVGAPTEINIVERVPV